MSTAGSAAAAETTTPATPPPAAEPAPVPAKNKGGRPSNASKAAAAAGAPAAKVDAPASAKAPEITAPTPPPAAKPEDTIGGRKAAAEAEEKAAKAAEELAAAPRSKSLDAVRAARRARVEAEAAAKAGTAATGDKAADEAAAAAKAAEQATGGKKEPTAEEKAAAELAAKEAEEKTKADAAKKKAETVETDIPADKLKEFTKLNRDLRTATTELRELKANDVPLAESLKKAAGLAKEGKHYDAIRLLKAHGIDFDKAAAEVLRVTAEEAELDPETKKLRDDLAAANDRLAKLEDGQTQAQKDAKAAAAITEKAMKETRVGQIIAEVTLAAERFPYLSKSEEFTREALEGADEAYPLAVKHLGRQLTDDEKNNLLRAALEEAEDRHAARAKLYGKDKPAKKAKEEEAAATTAAAAAAAGSTTPTTADGGMRGSVQTIVPHRKRTLADIKAERKAQGRR